MTWPVRSKRLGLYNGTPAANTPVALGTVPAGKTWLFKEWSVYAAGASTHTIVIMINVGGTRTVIDRAVVTSGTTSGQSERHTVLNAGEVLEFQTTSATAIMVTSSGAQLG